jgi:hypothetical protein
MAACVFLTVGAGLAPASADDSGALYVAPGPSTLIPADAMRRYQEQSAGTSRRLGDMIGGSLKTPTSHATELVVTTRCGHYKYANITYSDGSSKSMNLSDAPATQNDLAQAKAAIPILRVVDLPGCDDPTPANPHAGH